MTKKFPTTSATSLLALLLVGFFSIGCQELGAVALLISGPPKIPAAHELDKSRTTTILIEDGSRGAPIPRSLRSEMLDEAQDLLIKKADLKDIVSGESALRAARAERGGRKLSISEVGRAVESEVVIHVNMLRLGVTPDGTTHQPVVDMDVRVVDARSGRRLWPTNTPAHRVRATDTVRPGTLPPPGQRTPLAVDAARWAGRVLAELFYEHARTDAADKGQR